MIPVAYIMSMQVHEGEPLQGFEDLGKARGAYPCSYKRPKRTHTGKVMLVDEPLPAVRILLDRGWLDIPAIVQWGPPPRVMPAGGVIEVDLVGWVPAPADTDEPCPE